MAVATTTAPRRSAGRRLSDLLAGRPRLQVGLLLSGPLGWLVVAYLGSLAVLFVAAFWQLDDFSGEIVRRPTTANFELLWSSGVYRTIALRTIGVAALVTVTDAVLAFPVAFYMAKVATPRVRGLLVVAVLMPLWASYLVKVYAWREILAADGILNWALGPLGLKGPGFGVVAAWLVFSYLWLPYMCCRSTRGCSASPARCSTPPATSAVGRARRSAAWCCRWPCRRSWPARSSPSR